jgi:glutathione S-transferase
MTAACPTLYSFRRCPYAMRARMALYASGQIYQHREIVLADKPSEMLALSPKSTVPVLQLEGGQVIDESLDIMLWTLERNDPLFWLEPEQGSRFDMLVLITRIEDEFKYHLDRYKYATRYDSADPQFHRTQAEKTVRDLDDCLGRAAYLFGTRPALADYATAPFIRQFANTDRDWFDKLPYARLHKWLADILSSEIFITIMAKYPLWQPSSAPVFSQIPGPL